MTELNKLIPRRGGGWQTPDGRFVVLRYHSKKWIIKDTPIDLIRCKRIIGYSKNLNEAETMIEKARDEVVKYTRHEIPLIVEIRAETRELALESAQNIADALGEVFADKGCLQATAVITDNHNVLEPLGIRVDGHPE